MKLLKIKRGNGPSRGKFWKRKKYSNLHSEDNPIYSSSGQSSGCQEQHQDEIEDQQATVVDWDTILVGDEQFSCQCQQNATRDRNNLDSVTECNVCKADKKLDKKKRKKLKKVGTEKRGH